MFERTLKQKLANRERLVGTWSVIPSPVVADAIAENLDFVIIDMEHGPITFETAQNMLIALRGQDCHGMIRIPDYAESNILKAFDIGAEGIIVPQIEHHHALWDIASRSKYPPLGRRGLSPYTRAGQYGSRKEHLRKSNEETVTSVIIENKNALDALEIIVKDKVVDLLYFGIYDISLALGHPGDISHKDVRDTIEQGIRLAADAGISVGGFVHNKEEMNMYGNMGMNFFAYGVDAYILQKGYDGLQGH